MAKNKYPMARICRYCGETFLIEGPKQSCKQYCTDRCSYTAIRERQKARRAAGVDKQTEERRSLRLQEEKKKKQQQKPKIGLVDYTVKARQQGMTYGQLQAQEYINAKRHDWSKKKEKKND